MSPENDWATAAIVRTTILGVDLPRSPLIKKQTGELVTKHYYQLTHPKPTSRSESQQLSTDCDRSRLYRPRIATALGLVATIATGTATAQPLDAISYTLSFANPHTHYVSIEATIPTDDRTHIELMMPTWTPGSYLVREFARHVESLTARTPGGDSLAVEKSRKNRWLMTTAGASSIIVSYRVYGREMSVRTNWIDADFAMLNGAPTFLTLADDHDERPHDVTLNIPTDWSRALTGLKPHPNGEPNTYRADDYDILVDSPIVVGNPTVYQFTVDDTLHQLVNIGESGVWRGAESANDVEAITREIYRMWGTMPYDRYLFFNMITEAGGGLEHRNSALLMSSRWDTASRRSYLRWLGLVSHELFHAWNIKRLRPVELGPFDYETEVHTESLWVVEGLTSYYADLGVHRAGLSTEDEYLESLSRQIRNLQTTPGREVQPVALASYDAWIKYYRSDENSRNSSVSYYAKGAVLGFLLDMRIRVATASDKTLDDLMRLAYARYSDAQGFTPEEFRSSAQDVAGVDLSSWFSRALDTTEDLDYSAALNWLGLEFSDEPENEHRGWIGLVTRTASGRLLVGEVLRDTPGYEAGFNVDDELLAIDAHRVLPNQWNERITQATPGSELVVLVSRRGELRPIHVEVGTRPANRWQLQFTEEPTLSQQRHRQAWLTGS
ncbi:MAG: PDZ domain-containing protein [Acidobacteriota bacterium]|nr:PDZ domain-containing protein [Acidobacteriota bacterium]